MGGGGEPTRTTSPSRPPFLLLEVERGKEREREKERGGRAPFPLSNSDTHGGGTPCGLPYLSPMAHVGPLLSPGGSGNPPVLQYVPGTPGIIPVSKYYRPIYQSLPLDHFETPR